MRTPGAIRAENGVTERRDAHLTLFGLTLQVLSSRVIQGSGTDHKDYKPVVYTAIVVKEMRPSDQHERASEAQRAIPR